MSKSRFVLTAIVVMLILSFTFSSVAADTQPPVEPVMTDEDGDLVVDGLSVFSADSSGERSGTQPFTVRYDEDALPVEPIVAEASEPVSPDYEYVFTKTPKFWFTRDYSATKYKIAVYDYYSSQLIYTYKGTGTCEGDFCWLRPDTVLKPYGLDPKGWYVWGVQAKVGGIWQSWSSYTEFRVASTGFTSTFDTTKKWYSVYGAWSIVSPGYLKTKGVTGYSSSVIEKHYFVSSNADYYVYEVKMKRKTEETSANRIYFGGWPFPGEENGWDETYAFQYTNDGSYSLWRRDDGVATPLIDWTYSSYIKPYDWNKLTVYRDYPYIDLWINGEYLGYVEDTTYPGGYVGVGMYESDTYSSALLVDKASLYYSDNPPYWWPWSVDSAAAGSREAAYNLTATPGTAGQNENIAP